MESLRKKLWGLPLLLAILLLFGLTGCSDDGDDNDSDIPEPAVSEKSTFAVFSDPHYYDIGLGVTGSAFEAYLAADRKLLRESEAILQSTLDAILDNDAVEFVIVPGDLTKDGELQSHLGFANYLRTLEANGISVYVVPGNHDVSNPHAYAYDGDEVTLVPWVSPEEFAQIYADFGYDEALYRDPNSLSYVAEPAPGLWLLGMDSCMYDENEALGKPVTGGRFSEETLNWILERLAQAETENKCVISMMHHGMTEHFTGQSQINPGSEYVLQDWETVSRTLAEAGLDLVFTGHYHAQDITTRTWDTASLTDVETGSLATYPCPYRVVTLSPGKMADIQSGFITEIDYDTGGVPFPDYAEAYLTQGLYGQAEYFLTTPADQGGYGLTPEQAAALGPQIAEAYKAHYSGDETPTEATLSAVNTYLQSDDPTMLLLGQMLYSLWTDLPPADTTVMLDLGLR